MDSIINRLTEIEETASSIVEHAEEQKAVLDQEYDEKRRKFDAELEEKTQARIQTIQNKVKEETLKWWKDRAVPAAWKLSCFEKNMSRDIRSMPGIF